MVDYLFNRYAHSAGPKNHQKRPFLRVSDLGTNLDFFFVQFRIEHTSRRPISRDFEIFENSLKDKFWFVRGVTGKAREPGNINF